MKWRTIIRMATLLFTLVTMGCAGMNTYQSPTPGGPNRFGCEGDAPSPYPPYCHSSP